MSKRMRVIFGSTSDESKVLPGILRFTQENLGTEVEVQYASADNTSEKVHGFIMDRLRQIGRDPSVFISGAGLSNVLTGVIKSQSFSYDLNIGLPVSDDSSSGLASLLSTSEKPPRNPVLTVGIDNAYAACNIANRFMGGLRNVVVIGQDAPQGSEEVNRRNAVDRFLCKLIEFGIPHRVCDIGGVSSGDVVVSLFGADSSPYNIVRAVDENLKKISGVQVAVSYSPIVMFGARDYAHLLDNTIATGIVSSQGYDNAVQMAAILTRNTQVIDKISEARQKKINELNAHKGLLISGGEVRKL